jgi:hypothetical protein
VFARIPYANVQDFPALRAFSAGDAARQII